MRKRFDRDLYNETDKLAKNSAIKLVDSAKYTVTENPKKTNVDLLVADNEGKHIFNIECEIKKVWKTKEFPYESVQFPERKAKYANLDTPTIFVMFNHDLSSFLAVSGNSLLSSPCVEVPNKYVHKGEKFFQVPLTSVSFDDINKVIKEII